MRKVKNAKKRLMRRVNKGEPRALKRWADLADYREQRTKRLRMINAGKTTESR